MRSRSRRERGESAGLRPGSALTIEELEQLLIDAAYAVVKYGDAYAPYLDRFEAELEERRRKNTPEDRARRLLENYTIEGGRKAILVNQSRF